MVRSTKHGHMTHRLKYWVRLTEVLTLQWILFDLLNINSQKKMKCGGTGDTKQADPAVQEICDSVSCRTMSLFAANKACLWWWFYIICAQVKGQVENKTGKKYNTFKAKSYKTQVVAGTNYFVKVRFCGILSSTCSLKLISHFLKVHVGGEEHVHLRIFKGLPHTGGALEVHGFQESKTHHDPIVYFDWASRMTISLVPA